MQPNTIERLTYNLKTYLKKTDFALFGKWGAEVGGIDAEWLFIKLLILHLNTVRRAMQSGLFVEHKGLQADICEFSSSPIPKAIWKKLKPLQNDQVVAFVESCRNWK